MSSDKALRRLGSDSCAPARAGLEILNCETEKAPAFWGREFRKLRVAEDYCESFVKKTATNARFEEI